MAYIVEDSVTLVSHKLKEDQVDNEKFMECWERESDKFSSQHKFFNK